MSEKRWGEGSILPPRSLYLSGFSSRPNLHISNFIAKLLKKNREACNRFKIPSCQLYSPLPCFNAAVRENARKNDSRDDSGCIKLRCTCLTSSMHLLFERPFLPQPKYHLMIIYISFDLGFKCRSSFL